MSQLNNCRIPFRPAFLTQFFNGTTRKYPGSENIFLGFIPFSGGVCLLSTFLTNISYCCAIGSERERAAAVRSAAEYCRLHCVGCFHFILRKNISARFTDFGKTKGAYFSISTVSKFTFQSRIYQINIET